MPDISKLDLTHGARGGTLRHLLLALLAQQPSTGYALGRLLRTRLGHAWTARLQQIYYELSILHKHGLLAVTTHELKNRPSKKTYSLTDAGGVILDRWLQRTSCSATHRDPMLIKLLCLERLNAALMINEINEREGRATIEIAAIEQQLSTIRPTNARRLGEALSLEATISRLRAEMDWCRRAKGRLIDLATIPPRTVHRTRQASINSAR